MLLQFFELKQDVKKIQIFKKKKISKPIIQKMLKWLFQPKSQINTHVGIISVLPNIEHCVENFVLLYSETPYTSNTPIFCNYHDSFTQMLILFHFEYVF